jgi:hypothetical protein
MTNKAEDTPGSSSLLSKLMGREVSSVTLFADYFNMSFERGYPLGFYSWPEIVLNTSAPTRRLVHGQDVDYEHMLWRTMGMIVTSVAASSGIQIVLDEEITLDLPATASSPGGDLLMYGSDPDGRWMVWNEDEGPFEKAPSK